MTSEYRPIGVKLTAVVENDYAPDSTETLTLYRCLLCGALVDTGSWATSGMEIHDEWHKQLSGSPAATRED